MANTFKVGASLYSLQLEYLNHEWSFEDCMQLASMTGGDKGVEIVGPMHHRCWPGLSNEFERAFKSGCERWELTPTQYGAYSEAAIVVDLDDRFDFHILQMQTTKKLGFPLCRIQTPGCDPLLERLAPVAEKMKVKLAVEITSGSNLMNPEGTMVETVKRINSEWLGFNPDCNMFEDRRKERGGKGPAGPAPGTGGRGEGGGQSPQRIPAADYERLVDVAPWMMHMHGKFHWAEKGTIPAVPFDKITELLLKLGFKGWMSTEFEGGELGEYQNSFEVVQVHHKIVKDAIAKYSKA
jgi:sugar phosphate isomerase/epimerase